MSQSEPHCQDLPRLVVERILSRVGRRVVGLIVAYCGDRIVVRGRAESYHVWQLAIAACRESLVEERHVGLDCHFEVTGESCQM
jgi:hypothetical protein